MRVLTRIFKSSVKSWEVLCREAADFATSLPAGRLISISHSADQNVGVVMVWYWGEPERCFSCGYDLTGNQSGRCPECGVVVLTRRA